MKGLKAQEKTKIVCRRSLASPGCQSCISPSHSRFSCSAVVSATCTSNLVGGEDPKESQASSRILFQHPFSVTLVSGVAGARNSILWAG